MNDATYALWLKAQRRKLKLSQKGLEEAAGLGEKYVTHLEGGRTPRPQEETRNKIHSVFGTSDEDLARDGILERVGSGKDAVYLWPDSASPARRESKPLPSITTSQAMAIIRKEAEAVNWTESLADAIAQTVRAMGEMQRSGDLGNVD